MPTRLGLSYWPGYHLRHTKCSRKMYKVPKSIFLLSVYMIVFLCLVCVHPGVAIMHREIHQHSSTTHDKGKTLTTGE